MNNPWELYRRGGPSLPEKTTAFLPSLLQQEERKPCHEPKVTASTGTSVERSRLALPFITVTLHLQKGQNGGQKNAAALRM